MLPAAGDHPSFLTAASSEMSARIRAMDWAATSLGPIESWAPSLRVTVSTCLGSRFPILIWWGPDLVMLYNDAYRPILGNKHPTALGSPGRDCWPEIWHIIGPMLSNVLASGTATWSENLMLPLERSGYPEECYFTFSYSPVREDDGQVSGVFCAVAETTQQVVGERRLAMLRALAAASSRANGVLPACDAAASVIADHAADIPFALIYLVDENGESASLVATAGVAAGDRGAPPQLALAAPSACWPLGLAAASLEAQIVDGLDGRFGRVPAGTWLQPPREAIVLPIPSSLAGRATGFLVVGVGAGHALDEQYRGYYELAAGQLGTAIGNARAYEEERRRTRALAELDRAKTRFFSNVSHEFRTPLTLLLSPLEDLLARTADPAARELLLVAWRNGERLLKLVNSLLEFTRIEAGRVRARYEPVELGAYTADLASVFRSAIEKAGLRFVVDCPAMADPIFVDREMWEQVVLNLLSNALKFTFTGEIGVCLRAEDGGVALSIRDTGTGIPADEMPKLFQRFHRIEHARGRSSEGTGIGLALVQELVKLHGGTIDAQSEVGTGTTFTVRLPAGSGHLPPDAVAAAAADRTTSRYANAMLEEALRWLPDAEGRPAAASEATDAPPDAAADAPLAGGRGVARVLLADDNADMREYVRRLLAPDYIVTAVADGERALASALAARPDLVIADVMMPNLDGFGLLKALRGDPRTADVPVLLLSARAGEEARVEGLQAGADDYLVKPFSARELLARVGARLEVARVHRDALAREQALRELAEARAEERAFAQAELAAANQRLQDTDRRKDEFLAMLAHELRNPLAVMGTASDVLHSSGDARPEIRRAREVIQRQARHMGRLIDDLLDVARVTQGKVGLQKQRVEMAAVVREAVEAAAPAIEAKGHRLHVSLPGDPLPVDADTVRLTQVVSNLLSNAAKYTPPKGEIRVSAERHADAVTVTVTDNGQGIDDRLLPHVFDLFVQGQRSFDRQQGGLGIGLTMARSLVELHGGTIAARSDGPGKGSEFVITLPLAAESASDRPAAPPPDRPSLSKRILLVDDNADALDMMRTLLQLEGHEVTTACDGPTALAVACRWLPDVGLIDLGMPGMDGFEVARQLRREPSLASTVLVAVTGYGQENDVRRAREAGFDYHFTKSADFLPLRELLTSLRRSR